MLQGDVHFTYRYVQIKKVICTVIILYIIYNYSIFVQINGNFIKLYKRRVFFVFRSQRGPSAVVARNYSEK